MTKEEFIKKTQNMQIPKYFSATSMKEAFEEGFKAAKNEALFNINFLEKSFYGKEKVIEEIEFKKYNHPFSDLSCGYNQGLHDAVNIIKEFNDTEINLDTIKENTPPHYQGSIQPIDLINAQDLNFNLGNVVKYVCRAGKKQGENILTDLEKAKDYINFEIERVKKWILSIY